VADGLFGTGAFIGNPNIQRQGARARELAQRRDVNTLPDPRTYAAVAGLFGTAPDQMGFSVLHPQYQQIQQVALPAFVAGTALSFTPAIGKNIASNVLESVTNKNALALAQANNTFTSNSYGYGFGRRMGYPQEKGTPIEKLFANFADNIKSDEAKSQFRQSMLNRAQNFRSSKALTTEFDFNGYKGFLDTNRFGDTRIRIKDGDDVVAAARLDKGMLDSIAVSEKYKGQEIGKDLLDFIDRTKIGNVYEVPDRSPGFVKIQKSLLLDRKKEGVDPTVPTPLTYIDPFGNTISDTVR
jgi:ribosomal protein S18 acetylase RimI-like enzyme